MELELAYPQQIQGLYLITPDIAQAALGDLLVSHIAAALTAGVRIVQWRNKSLELADQRPLAAECRAICRAFGATLIVNDHLELAQEIDADGLHIGQEDGEIDSIRRAWPKLLGVSCYNQLGLATHATAHGADYLAFGAVFPSSTKPNTVRADLNLFAQSRDLQPAKVAIGGIQAAHIPQLLAAGADAWAVLSALIDLSKPLSHTTQRVTEFLQIAQANLSPRTNFTNSH